MKRIFVLATSSIALLGMAIAPSTAGGMVGGVVSGVTGTVGAVTGTVGGVVGGVTGTVGGVVGGVTGAVGNTVGGVTGALGGVTGAAGGANGSTGAGGSSGLLSNNVLNSTPRSTLLNGLQAQLKLLSKRELVRLCLNAGGAADCGGSQEQVMQLVDVRLSALSKRQLANLCVSVGSSCGVNGANGGTKVTTSLLGPKGLANAKVKSNLIGGINAKADVLSGKDLVKLCVNAGGGTGCGNGSRNQILGLIDSRLGLLSTTGLANLCLSVGGSCGGSGNAGNPGGDNPGGDNSGGNNPGRNRFAGMTSSSERQALQRRCPTILRNPAAFDSDLVRLCKLAARI